MSFTSVLQKADVVVVDHVFLLCFLLANVFCDHVLLPVYHYQLLVQGSANLSVPGCKNFAVEQQY